MALYGTHPPISLAEDPTDPVWRWFILNGPHGERFQWERFGDLPRDIEFLKKFIEERTVTDAAFPQKARLIALKALEVRNIVLVRTAIQVLTVLGTDKDMDLIKRYLDVDNEEVLKDAMCALFERGFKVKRRS